MTAEPRPSPLTTAGAWCLAVLLASSLVVLTGYRTGDADSRVYVTIAAHLSAEPSARWIAPQWWGAWGMQGLFREHPVGIFIAPAMLARAGLPAAQAPYIVTLTAQAVCVLLLVALVARVTPRPHGHLLAWFLPLIPIAFVFRVRANQEFPLLAGVLLAVYGIARARRDAAWLLPALAGFVGALLVKGIFALLAPMYAALWLLMVPTPPDSRKWTPWLGVAAMAAVTPLLAAAYEHAYVAATGQSFLEYYLGARMSLEGATPAGGLPAPVEKSYNALWYGGRLLWYAAPWSLALLLVSRVTRPPVANVIRFAAVASLATLLLLALRDTKADRYVFPAYFLAATGGVLAAAAWSPRLGRLAARLEEAWPWGPALLWLALVAGRVLIG